MDADVCKHIVSDHQIIKFKLYGFFKNLKFFEPYLLLFFVSKHLTLLQIGFLISIRELIVNVFELPSGLVADYWGKKKELLLCFVFYMVSFVFFYATSSFGTAAIAMILFGLGEAFRSGSHKAMIFTYLERKHWQDYKAYVYGRTRGSSLIGSALSSLISILLILKLPSFNGIFLFSLVPYAFDFLLILSYPSYLDTTNKETDKSFVSFFSDIVRGLRVNKPLRHLILGAGVFEGTIAGMKDMVQPILEGLALSSGMILVATLSPDKNLKIVLGLLYMVISLMSVVSTRNAYRLSNHIASQTLLNTVHFLLVFCLLMIAFWIKKPLIVCLVFIMIHIIHNARKPIFIAVIDDNMHKSERATVLSLESQVKSLVTIIVAPFVGFVADTYSMRLAFLLLAFLLVCIFPFLEVLKKKKLALNV